MGKGFTLIELSIVLVIIGMLTGAILAGRSLLTSSSIASQVAQLQEFDAAVQNYKSWSGYLPGDSPLFDDDGGNGNGLVESSPNHAGINGRIYNYACETEKFWKHLFPDEYTINGTCKRDLATWNLWTDKGAAQPVTKGTNRNAPAPKIGISGAFIAVMPQTHDSGWVSPIVGSSYYQGMNNYYTIWHPSHAQTPPYIFNNMPHLTKPTDASTKPSDLLKLDRKIDDGLANAGDVQPGIRGNVNHVRIRSNYHANFFGCSSGANYDLSDNDYNCTPFIRVGVFSE